MSRHARLRWRIRAFFSGAVLGLTGILLGVPWLVTAALIVLFVGVVMRTSAAPDAGSEEQEPSGTER